MLLLTVTVALTAGFAAWISNGQLTISSGPFGATRVAVLPSAAWLALACLAAAAIARAMPMRSRPVIALSALVFLTWLPVPIAPAFYMWTGPLRTWLWSAIMAAALAPAMWRLTRRALATHVANPTRAPWLAGILAAMLYAGAAWQVSPQLPTGDEPHYLVITQSLLRDRDLQIENNYRAGAYREYYPFDLKPDYLRRGRDGEIYSVHAPGLPLLVMPAFALAGYSGVVVFLAILSGLATALAWTAAWRATGDVAASWFGWATVGLSVPFFFQSFTAYPDAPGATLIMFAVLTTMAGREASFGRLALTGGALAALPWLHTRLAIAAAVLGGAIALRHRHAPFGARRIAALFAVPAASALAWLAFFDWMYGTPDPRAPYAGIAQGSLANLPRGIVGLLFDQQFGLVPNAPVYLCALIGFGALARRWPRLAVELIAVIVPYGLAVAAFQMWWGGSSSPARFLVPVLLPLAIPAGVWFTHAERRGSQVLGLAALFVSGLMTATIVLVQRGGLLYNARDGASRLLLWLSPVVNLTTAFPSLFQNEPRIALVHAMVWLGAAGITAAAVRTIARRGSSRAEVVVWCGLIATVASSVALTIVWAMNRAAPLTPTTGAIALLHRFDPDSRQIAVRYARLDRLPFVESIARLPLNELPIHVPLAEAALSSRRRNEPVIFLENVPAATYVIEATVPRGGSGVVTVTLDRQYGPAWRWDLGDGAGVWRREFHLPVRAPALVVDGDESARQRIERLSIRAARVVGSRERLTSAQPAHVARYASALVFVMNGEPDMESSGIWIGGGGHVDFVIAPDDPRPIRLLVRNPPIENQVTLEAGRWRQALEMKPGEERMIEVPMAPDRNAIALTITSARGARPSEYEKGSADTRLLGAWIEWR